jgi:hypothetical protein
VKRLWSLTGGIVLVVAVGLDMILRHHVHAIFWWHRVPAFEVLYGLLGSLLLVWGTKWLGHAWLQRDVDYYREDDA